MNKFRHIIAFLLAAALLFSVALAETTASVKLQYKDGSLRLRAGAGTTYSTNGYLHDGDQIVILSEGSVWSKVRSVSTGKSGYIKNKYFVKNSSAPDTVKFITGKSVYVSESGGSLRVRAGAGTSYATNGYVEHGDRITITSLGSEWSKIKVDATGLTGYIKNTYIYGYGTAGWSSAISGSDWWDDWDDTSPADDWDSTAYDPGTVTTKYASSTVNVRSGPASTYKKLTQLKRGDHVKIIGNSGNWYKIITAGSVTGYISKNYVTVGRTAKTTARLNVRKGPSSSTGRITTLQSGTTVTVTSIDGNWAHIKYSGGNTGYVSMNYLKMS
ncbi:MAG: SH3 domain-containing protein [Clostridia bacterium]|nr:SH3 domain-containing protein [Clostridia bacterium]